MRVFVCIALVPKGDSAILNAILNCVIDSSRGTDKIKARGRIQSCKLRGGVER